MLSLSTKPFLQTHYWTGSICYASFSPSCRQAQDWRKFFNHFYKVKDQCIPRIWQPSKVWGFLKDCISISVGDVSISLRASLTELINHIINGHLPTALWPFFYGAQLHGLLKSNEDLIPITVCCTYWCRAAKVCLIPYISRFHKLLQPSQVGIGTPWGCEATVYAMDSFMAQTQSEKSLLKLDVKMPSIASAETVQTRLPEIYPFIWDCYSSKTSFSWRVLPWLSHYCTIRGHYLSGSFCPRHSQIHIQGQIWPKCLVPWYGYIGWDLRIVLSNAAIVRNGLPSVGLEINNSKCELFIINNTTS